MSGGRRRGGRRQVDQIRQFLAGLEIRDPFRRNFDARACLRIAGNSGPALPVLKLPNQRISTLSPDRSARTMLSGTVTTIVSDSFREMSNAGETASVRSALVIMGSLVLPGKGRTAAGPVCRRAQPSTP